jgi:DNA-binding transcriptional LysR family regulator
MKDLENEVFILREHSSGTRMKVEEVLKEHNISYQTQWNCYSFESIKEAILHNLGITIMSPRVISRELIDGSLWACMIDDVDLSRSFNLIYRKNKFLSEPMQQFIGVCTKLESAK